MEQKELNIKDGIWAHVLRCWRVSGMEMESLVWPNPLMSYILRINCNAMLLLYMDEFEKKLLIGLLSYWRPARVS